MAEHLVIRDAALSLSAGRMKKVSVGEVGCLIQSGKNRPFKTNEIDQPFNVHPEDTIFLAEKGYGVYAECTVNFVSPIRRFIKGEDTNRFAEMISQKDPYLCNPYWQEVRTLYNDLPLGKSLYFCFIDYKVVKIVNYAFSDKPRNRRSWYSNSVRQFIDFGKTPWQAATSNVELYGNIPSVVKYEVARLWKINCLDTVDFDHYIPKSLGAPGIYPENVVPMLFSMNRIKSDRIPKQLVEVAKDDPRLRKFFSQEDVDLWDPVIRHGGLFKRQKKIARDIVSEVKNWGSESEEREFYRKILTKSFVGDLVESKGLEGMSKKELIKLVHEYKKLLAPERFEFST
jgi:hypothetical protein